MDIFLKNDIISDLQYTDYEIATYVALKSLYNSTRETQFVSYNLIGYELFNSKFSNTAINYIKTAFHSLIDRGLVSIVQQFSSTGFEIDLSKLYFENEYYTVVHLDEVRTIINIDNRMDKFKLLRYFITCLRSICKTQGVYTDNQYTKQNFVGFMTQQFLCKESGISYETNFKLIEQYNTVLEENNLLYIYRHTEMKRNSQTGQIKSFPNHYGRYSDKEDIITFAKNYEKYVGIDEELVQSDKSNQRRRLASQYNNLCNDFDKYVDKYSDDELIEIFKYIHFRNTEIYKQLDNVDKTSPFYDDLADKVVDENVFFDIPCVIDYIDREVNNSKEKPKENVKVIKVRATA